MGHTTVARIADPDRARVSTAVEAAILAIEIPDRPGDVAAPNALVPIVGARRRIQALVSYGYPQSHLSRELNMHPGGRTMAGLVGRTDSEGRVAHTITAERERAIKVLFDRLQHVPGPSDAARRCGERNGWPLPLEWDETTIDQPDGQPVESRWTPASTREEQREQVALRREQVSALTARGFGAVEIASRLEVSADVVTADRARITNHPALGLGHGLDQDWGLDR
ncbi:MAG: hypothetical protein HOQ24_08675 [Mycobacteriaceae bacterium]|nr:hypothetical protein [Mycobacteriaceae bacterium]